MESQINLKITNNTSLTQQVDILSVINNPIASNNCNTIYEYDLTGQTLSSSLQITYYLIPDILTPLSKTVNALPTISGYVDALNSLGLGLFMYSGNTIYVSSSTYKFDKLDF